MPDRSKLVQSKVNGCSVVVHRPKDWENAVAVVLGHGAGQDMHSPFMSFFHDRIAESGHLSIKFNFAFMEAGRRAPDPQKRLRQTYADVIAWVQSEFEPRQGIVTGGKSMGGRVASYIAGNIDEVRGLVFLGYPLHPPGRVDRLRDEHLYELRKPMLFVSGTRDSLAQKESLEAVVRKLGRRATLHWIEGGDHSFKLRKTEARKSGQEPLAEAVELIRIWTGGFKSG